MTVVASAVGPLFLALWVDRTGSYAAAFYVLAAIVAVLGVAAALVSIPAGAQPARRQPTNVAAKTLLDQINGGSAPTIIDVRTVEEFSQGHVPGAINIPFHSISRQLDRIPGARRNPVVVYCGHGPRAWMAVAVLRRHGFTNVKYLAGHFSNWRASGVREER
jgi:rhodanese-related sulfurtransferase